MRSGSEFEFESRPNSRLSNHGPLGRTLEDDQDDPDCDNLKNLQDRLLAFPPHGEATWAAFSQALGSLCEACSRFTATPGSGWATMPSFNGREILSLDSLRKARLSEQEGCPLCKAISKVVEHFGDFEGRPWASLGLSILGPSSMMIHTESWSRLGEELYIISLRNGEHPSKYRVKSVWC